MADKLKERQPQLKTTSMEVDLNGRQPQWKTTEFLNDNRNKDNLKETKINTKPQMK